LVSVSTLYYMKVSNYLIGPLLWHWENNNTNDLSIELDLEEVKILARNLGFVINVSPSVPEYSKDKLRAQQNERHIKTSYTNNAQSMLAYTYNAAFWIAMKVDV
jgi:carnosine N-methyltransferase